MPKKQERKKPMIFLNQGDILPWKRPLPPGCVSVLGMNMYDGNTEVEEYAGYEFVSRKVGGFLVSASAAKYIANISKLSKDRLRIEGKITNPPKKLVLFSGGIQIYHEGVIPGTNIRGLDLSAVGEIWAASENRNLDRLIWGDAWTDAKKEKRIIEIVRGYEFQEEAKRDAADKREHEAHRRGFNEGCDDMGVGAFR